MYFTSGSDRAFEQLMQTRPGADHFDSGEAGAPEDCGTCRFYRPHWKYQFCVYEECPYQPGKRTALDGAVKFQVKGVDDEMAVFRVEKNRGYTVMSNHHLRNKDLSLKAKGLLSQMLSLPEDWDFTLKGLSLINREQIDAIRAAVKELEQAGYIVRSRERDSQGGGQKAQADPKDNAEAKETIHPGAACRRQGGTEKEAPGAGKIKRNGGMRNVFHRGRRKSDLSVPQCRPPQDGGKSPGGTAGHGQGNGGAGLPDSR